MESFTLEQIRDYWTKQAQQHGVSPVASWSDQPVIDMEIREIAKYLDAGDRVLDVGCANGYSTVQYAALKPCHLRGLDYIPEMIDQARLRVSALEIALQGTVEFAVGDITALAEPSASYDKIIVTRVLINLQNEKRQLIALQECARSLRPGGLLLLSEATRQGWSQLNSFRQEWGLPPIPMPPFNLYLDQEALIEAARTEFSTEAVVNFASSYYVGTRVLKPLLARTLDCNIDVADPQMHWNRWFSHLPSAGDYGTQKLFVLRKR